MKVLLILTLFLALSLAAPVKDNTNNSNGGVKVNRRYSLRKNLRRDAAVKPPPGSIAPEGIAASANSRPEKLGVGTVRKKVGTKPFGEPDVKATPEPPVFPPKPEEPLTVTNAPKQPPTLPPTTRAPATEAVAQPAVAPTEAALPPPPPPPPLVNTTGTATTATEDDSSSEEDDEDQDEDQDDYDDDENDYDDDDDDGRQLFPLHKPKTKGTHEPEDALSSKHVEPEPKPYKVKAYVTQTGQILVPIETFQQYFDFPAHVVVPEVQQELDDYRSYGPPAGYIVSRQENIETSNSEEESSETSSTVAAKDEEEAESEESVAPPAPAPVSNTKPKVTYQKPNKKNTKPPKVQQQAQQIVEQAEVNSEEAEDKESEERPVRGNSEDSGSVSVETEEKVTSGESNENENQNTNVPVRTQPEKKPQPQQQPRPQGRPPLAVIPAGAPTNEDDEEEAGRSGFQFFDYHSPIFEPYYDDGGYLFDQDHDYFL